MSGWLIVLAVGAGTYAARLSFIGALWKRRLPATAQRALEYVAPAVFAALVAPAVLLPDGAIDVTPASNPRLAAAALAGLAAWRLNNVVAVIVVGMGSLWVLQALL
jgi:branched-subunit amino acid transport protein